MRIEVHSPTWKAVRAHAVKEIATLTEALIAGGPDSRDDEIRGQIKALRALLALEADREPIDDTSVSY